MVPDLPQQAMSIYADRSVAEHYNQRIDLHCVAGVFKSIWQVVGHANVRFVTHVSFLQLVCNKFLLIYWSILTTSFSGIYSSVLSLGLAFLSFALGLTETLAHAGATRCQGTCRLGKIVYLLCNFSTSRSIFRLMVVLIAAQTCAYEFAFWAWASVHPAFGILFPVYHVRAGVSVVRGASSILH